jgi:hypothetical protein
VAISTAGWVVAGTLGANGHQDGAILFSRDGRHWRRARGQGSPEPLPLPAGIYGAEGQTVTAQGARLVVTGTTQASAAAEFDHSLSWVSSDQGRTWRTGGAVTGPAQLSAVTVVPGGFVATGNQGADELDAAAWTSVDGLAWRSVDLGLSKTSGPATKACWARSCTRVGSWWWVWTPHPRAAAIAPRVCRCRDHDQVGAEQRGVSSLFAPWSRRKVAEGVAVASSVTTVRRWTRAVRWLRSAGRQTTPPARRSTR